jgi:thiamine transporter ThiT
MKVLSAFLIVVAIAWALAGMWFNLVMSGIAEPVCRACAVAGLLFGPLLLIVGAAFALVGWHAKLGAIMALVACGILTLFVAYGTGGPLHVEPLQAKRDISDYMIFAVMMAVALLADAGALRLLHLAFSAGSSQTP